MGEFQVLVSSTVLCVEAQVYRKRGNDFVKERTKVFYSFLCRGKMKAAILYASKREIEGVLMLGNIDDDNGDLVVEILEKKSHVGENMEISSLLFF